MGETVSVKNGSGAKGNRLEVLQARFDALAPEGAATSSPSPTTARWSPACSRRCPTAAS